MTNTQKFVKILYVPRNETLFFALIICLIARFSVSPLFFYSSQLQRLFISYVYFSRFKNKTIFCTIFFILFCGSVYTFEKKNITFMYQGWVSERKKNVTKNCFFCITRNFAILSGTVQRRGWIGYGKNIFLCSIIMRKNSFSIIFKLQTGFF